MTPSEEGIRLAKRVAADQNCSRREAEALIVAGGVQVAGKVVTDPARRVRDEQPVNVNRLVSMAALAPLTLVLFKPAHKVANLAWLQDTVARSTDYWRAVLGASMLLLVLVFPQGIAGSVQALWQRVRGASA